MLRVEGETIVGAPRLYADGVFSSDDGRARFMAGPWRGMVTAGEDIERDRYRFFINNGRSNLNWRNWFLDQENDFVRDRFPYPIIEMNPADMADIGVTAGDLVEVHNSNGATQALAYPLDTARAGETFMIFGSPKGAQGNVIGEGVNELVIPVYKQTWADIRKLSDTPAAARRMSFKALEYKVRGQTQAPARDLTPGGRAKACHRPLLTRRPAFLSRRRHGPPPRRASPPRRAHTSPSRRSRS